MYRIALNTAISYFRQAKRAADVQRLSVGHIEIPDFGEGPDLELLNFAIQRLSQVEKALIMLYLEEKSYQEISDILGITNTNVGVKINRIKIKLEKIIKELTL